MANKPAAKTARVRTNEPAAKTARVRTNEPAAPKAPEADKGVQDSTKPPEADKAPSSETHVDALLDTKAPVGDYTADAPKTGVMLQDSRPASRAVREALDKGDPVVTVTIPKDFTFTSDLGVPYEYKAGTDEMPKAHADHWYAKAHGVEIYVPIDRDSVR